VSATKFYLLFVLFALWLILVLERKLLWAWILSLVLAIGGIFLLPSVVWWFWGFFFLFTLVLLQIFQPELREYFVGKVPRRTPQYAQIAEEIRDFLTFALKHKLNGILVFRRKDPLEAFKQTGEEIRAKVDAPFLSQIFAEGSIFAKGAVIIEGEEITAVNCILPSSGPKYLSQWERKGAGLSKLVDALVVVFFEGSLTLFLEGERTKSTPQRVEAILKALRGGRKIRLV
ncbi:DNA integrity scanning protein DisA nucleotide-binding domain protein, partial [bacterium]|nr:DNA integrity scanning protein DisA nucleotide-binding domain protein [bacterium]